MSRVVHFEILAQDPEQAAKFYRTVFGWEISAWEGPQPYWLATTGPDHARGINGAIMGRQFSQPVINTVVVESLEACRDEIVKNGGTLAHGPHDIPGIGRHAYFEDPQGVMFGVLQPLAMGSPAGR